MCSFKVIKPHLSQMVGNGSDMKVGMDSSLVLQGNRLLSRELREDFKATNVRYLSCVSQMVLLCGNMQSHIHWKVKRQTSGNAIQPISREVVSSNTQDQLIQTTNLDYKMYVVKKGFQIISNKGVLFHIHCWPEILWKLKDSSKSEIFLLDSSIKSSFDL